MVDPAHVFGGGKYERDLASALHGNQTVIVKSTYDERTTHKSYIVSKKNFPERIILGSSRCQPLGKQHFAEDNVFNHSMSAAKLQDFIAVHQIYQETFGKTPKVSICIDPWLFNARVTDHQWRTLKEHYHNFFDEESSIDFRLFKPSRQLKYTFSIAYFQESVRHALKALAAGEPIKWNVGASIEIFELQKTKLAPNHQLKQPDGSLVYAAKDENIAPEKIDELINQFERSPKMRFLDGFTSVDEKIWKDFVRLLDVLKKQNVEIELLLVPFHPKVHNVLKSEKRFAQVLHVEDKIKEICTTAQTSCKGSYEPNFGNLDSADLVDLIHPKTSFFDRALKP